MPDRKGTARAHLLGKTGSTLELYLHIGTEKTGTSSVQNFFSANRELLSRRGILYPEAPGPKNHSGLTVAAQHISNGGSLRILFNLHSEKEVEQYRRKLVAGLESEYASRPFTTVVMSNEHCSSRLLDDAEVAWLQNALAPHFEKIRVVVYLRRQDDFLLSTYSTSVKSGATYKLDIPPQHILENRYDYWTLLSRWARVFGRENIICRKFERSALKNGDVVDDILSVTGIEPSDRFDRPEDANESLDAETLEYLRLFNAHVPRFSKKQPNSARANIVGVLSKMSTGPLVTLSGGRLQEFMDLFRESNRKVASEYFGGAREGGGDPLFESRSDSRERVAQTSLSTERAVEIGAFLWQQKQAQVERAVTKVKALKAAGATGATRGVRKHARSGSAPGSAGST